MTNFIPIFPLGIVVYPGEQLNLHIFEPKYKQLIDDCFKNKKPFGIPSFIENKMNEIGTLVEIIEISKVYDDGKMDIKTQGLEVFRILEVIKELPDKSYSGAIVSYPANIRTGSKPLMKKLISGVRSLHKILNVTKDFKKPPEEVWSYDIAHHAGLSLAEEYELLELMQELQRQEYIKRHLAKVVPVMEEMNLLKKRVQLNGHFKNLGGSDI